MPLALASLPAGMPVLVLDAQSSDTTPTIARDFGATVIERAWNGFVDARRFALTRVATGWTLMLDADEELEPELARAILAVDGSVSAYRVRRVTSLCGEPIRTCGWSEERIVRLFRTSGTELRANPAAGGNADLHEEWIPQAGVGDLPGALLHDSYPTLASYQEKFRRYTTIEARGRSSSPLQLAKAVAIAGPRFVWSLARYEGWRDGWRGLYVAFHAARYNVLVHWLSLNRR